MLRFLFFATVLLLTFQTAIAEPFGRLKKFKYDFYGKRRYHFAIHTSNPAGLGSKGGGSLEQRNGQWAYIAQYTKYWGGYPGTQYSAEYDKFFASRSNKEVFIYFKSFGGDATFDNKKLSLFGQTQEIVVGPQVYFGGGFGVGRRYHHKVLFWDWRLGFKYAAISETNTGVDEIDKASKNMFRLFYTTGPGSILDCHFGMGLQL